MYEMNFEPQFVPKSSMPSALSSRVVPESSCEQYPREIFRSRIDFRSRPEQMSGRDLWADTLKECCGKLSGYGEKGSRWLNYLPVIHLSALG